MLCTWGGGRPGWVMPGASLDMDFANGVYFGGPVSSLLTTTRASTGYAQWADGHLSSFAANVPRITDLGLLVEQAATNVVLWNRDLTNAAWTKSNITPLLNQTGADGTANSATSLTATAGNGTCLQAITLASSARFQSAYVKRLTGSGVINMTMDNGVTWTAITVTSAYTQLTIPTQTLANPTVGFRIVTSGDAIAVDLVGNETGTFATSPIATTTVPVTRAADVIKLTSNAWYNGIAGSIYANFTGTPSTANQGGVIAVNDNSSSNRIDLRSNNTHLTLTLITVGGSGQSAAQASQDIAASTRVKVAMSFQAGTENLATNGNLQTAAPASIPSSVAVSQTLIGALDNGGTQLNNYITRIALFNTALPSASLTALSQ